MIYLSGSVREEVMRRHNLGLMLTPMMWNRPDLAGTSWGADTGCFSKPEAYDTRAYLAWLDRLRPFWPTCLFATAPDVWSDARATLKAAAPVLPLIRQRVPAALVAQSGIVETQIPWGTFDVLFLGGPNEWQQSEAAWELVAEAKRRGKWVHKGRVNSLRRLQAAAAAGCDSADGTFLAFGPDVNLPQLEEWLDRLVTVPHLPLWPDGEIA